METLHSIQGQSRRMPAANVEILRVPARTASRADQPNTLAVRAPQASLAGRAAAMALPCWAIHAGLATALRAVLLRCAHELDLRMRRPLVVVVAARRRSIVLLGRPALIVHEQPQGGSGGAAQRLSGRLGPNVQLWPLLSRREWRRLLDDLLGCCAARDAAAMGGEGIEPTARSARMQRWVVATCQHLLDTDARFWRLRHVDVVDGLGLDAALLRTALRARLPAETRTLTWRQYQDVCAHADAFDRVARENPHLLRLAGAALHEGMFAGAADPVAVLARRVKVELSPKAWRYLVEHGVRRLRAAWRSAIDLPLDVVMDDLRGMQAAGWPPPLPPRLMRAWLRRAPADLCGLLPVEHRWLRPHVLGCAARHAHATRGQAVPSPAAEEFVRVAEWAYEHLGNLDARQSGRGWRWLVRQCDLHKERERLGFGPPAEWLSMVGAFDHEGWRIEPLTSPRSLIEAKLALRNCLDNYVRHSQRNEVRLFCVRDRSSLKLVGAIGLRPVAGESGRWQVFDVKGFANRPAPQWHAIAQTIAEQYSLADCAGDEQAMQLALEFDPPGLLLDLDGVQLGAGRNPANRSAGDMAPQRVTADVGGLLERLRARSDGGH